MTKRLVCRVQDVAERELRECQTDDGLKLVVANAGGGEFYGFQASCPHQEVPLCEGVFDGATLTCHMHLWQWDVRSGAPLGIAEAPLQKYTLTRDGDALYVESSGSALDAAPLFSGIGAQTLKALERLARREEFAEGGMIYDIGDPADDFFVLESGRVEFLIGRGDRTRPAGFRLGRGELFGWNALLENQPHRIARATCRERSSVLRLNGRQVLQVLESDAGCGYVVMRRLADLIARYLAGDAPRN
jgi:toluene monooxygenase system ferredoxin subunit